jgi:hypothetical protein
MAPGFLKLLAQKAEPSPRSGRRFCDNPMYDLPQ